jgi:hypothetical protein
MTGRRRGGDRGSVLVEAAFVLPILLFAFLALFDFTYAELKESDASNAARDGARVGMLSKSTSPLPWPMDPQATCDPSGADPAFTEVCDEVRSNLSAAPVSTVQARCYAAIGAAVDSAPAVPCNSDTLLADRSTIEEWQLVPMTFIGDTFVGERTMTTRSRMVIIN